MKMSGVQKQCLIFIRINRWVFKRRFLRESGSNNFTLAYMFRSRLYYENYWSLISVNFPFQLQPKKKVGKKVAAAPLAVKKVEPKKVTNPLFEKRTRNFGIGKLK